MDRRGRIVLTDRCTTCEHPVSATTVAELKAAIRAHVDYVNTQLDRTTDPHFEDERLIHLMVS